MWMILAFVLALVWIVCFVGFHVASAGIHLLLLLAVVAAVVHAMDGATNRRRVA